MREIIISILKLGQPTHISKLYNATNCQEDEIMEKRCRGVISNLHRTKKVIKLGKGFWQWVD